MRIITSFLCIMAAGHLMAQSTGIVNTPMELLTFRQARLMPGGSVDVGTYFSHVFMGKLPESLELKRDSIAGPLFYNIGLWLDLTSPHSRISFAGGVNFNYIGMVVAEKNTGLQNDLSVGQVQIPFMAKFMFGKKFVAFNPIFFVGGSYNLPVYFNNTDYSEDRKAILPTYSLQSGLALQYNFRGSQKIKYPANAGGRKFILYVPRIWLFLKADYTNANLFNTDLNPKIIRNAVNSDLDYRDLRFTVGLAAFLGSNKKYRIENK